MSPEDTDLERRVLAHEQILQSLLAALGERDPELLKSIIDRFSPSRRGAHEQDYRETADYAEAFVHGIARPSARGPAPRASAERVGASEEAFDRQPLSRLDGTIHICAAKLHGVWRVTRDGAFVGDYFERSSALGAAVALAQEVDVRGGAATVEIDGVSIDVPALPAAPAEPAVSVYGERWGPGPARTAHNGPGSIASDPASDRSRDRPRG